MSEIRVRGVNDEVVHLLRDQARRKGQSLQASLIELLTEAAMRPRQELLASLDSHQARLREKYGVMEDSTTYLRAQRDRSG